ncbi:MAG: hypothetical protein RLZZ480_796 [Candidatus Parcubacteria bacterium]|jgi:prepilin-type N-terminal cleavage/methylation domain-containing protein
MKYYTSQSGFSLVETLVAISILLLVIVGPMSISTSASRGTSYSSEQVTAFFLAQEGAELAQKARDDLQITYFADANRDPGVFTPTNPDPWADFSNTNGTYQSCFNATGCDFTITTSANGALTVHDCNSSATACSLYIDTTTSNLRARFTHTASGNTATPFTRKVLFERVSADEVKVTSRVTWRAGSFRNEQQVEVKTRLFNIYGN